VNNPLELIPYSVIPKFSIASTSLRKSSIYKYASKYRPTVLVKTSELPESQYIFAVHPHSTVPTFVSIAMMTEVNFICSSTIKLANSHNLVD
jgi:hypothetical protein